MFIDTCCHSVTGIIYPKSCCLFLHFQGDKNSTMSHLNPYLLVRGFFELEQYVEVTSGLKK